MLPLRRSPQAEPAAAPAKFEDMLRRLEKIVSDMEAADLPLEKLLTTYEEGMRLVKACGARLADAEQKVEILSKGAPAAAALSVPPVSPAVAAPLADGGDTEMKPAARQDDEIRLI